MRSDIDLALLNKLETLFHSYSSFGLLDLAEKSFSHSQIKCKRCAHQDSHAGTAIRMQTFILLANLLFVGLGISVVAFICELIYPRLVKKLKNM